MNDILKKIVYGCFAAYFVVSITCGTILSCRLEQARYELKYYRTELESATNREQQLASTIDKCWESTERTNQILSESTDTIQDVRRQLREVRENYQNMESLLLDSYDSMRNRNDTNYIEEVK